mmetsp:Transcript_15870/g.18053  ORF Transcript_15870/g.18053 Transcript_15870/m.18053 type:complete len:625 (+) Transcript_15870:87-1961(+)
MSSKIILCLQSRERRHVISLFPTASTRELYESASKEFPGNTIESLRGGGFPPQSIPSNDSEISNFVSNQDRIQVEFAKNIVKEKSRKSKHSAASNVTENDVNNVKGIRRSKRAASKMATEKMPAMIKAQEEYLKNTAKGSKKSSFSAVPLYNGEKRARENSEKQTKSKPQRIILSSSAGLGRRLSDGSTIKSPDRSRYAAVKRRRGMGNGTADMSTALLGAINDKSQMGIVLRKGMKNAVQTSYETSRAFSRLAAIQALSYRITSKDSSDGSNGSGERLNVTYNGSVDKTKLEETVDCIPRDILLNVLEGIHASNREALRPENLSRLSPRVIWSLVQYFPAINSVPDMYRELMPALDWKFLRRRSEQLSEKAMENKRQAAEIENGLDLEQASNAVAAVEHAMENIEDYHAEERKARQAQAAEARFRRQQHNEQNGGDVVVPWTLTTPSEPDRDELRECIENSASATSVGADVTKWTTQLMKQHNIHNWRELSNVEHVVEISGKLGVTEQQLLDWIDHAQNESLSEIMVEICDGHIEAVEILTKMINSGTPKDLAAWRSIPDLLLEQLQKQLKNVNEINSSQRSDPCRHRNQSWMELATISKWCNRAHQALQEYEWLSWYATPVD